MTIKDLRKICDKPRRNPERKINMWLSIYLTRPLLALRFSANQVTLLDFLIGVASGIFIYHKHYLIGALLLYLFHFLDFCDGAVARYRDTEGKEGKFLDHLVHLFINPYVFIMFNCWLGYVCGVAILLRSLIKSQPRIYFPAIIYLMIACFKIPNVFLLFCAIVFSADCLIELLRIRR